MSNGIGRISGPLLKENLLRNGIDLAFETSLLYLEVNDRRIGIKTDSPARQLEIDGNTLTTLLIADDFVKTPNIKLSSNSTITTEIGKLYLDSNLNISVSGIKTDKIIINNNKIYVDSIELDTDVLIQPTGKIETNKDLRVEANLHATGNITFEGTITIGDGDEDNVSFNADVNSDILPNQTDFYSLGDISKRWGDLYVKDTTADNIFTQNLISGGLNLTYNFTNTIFVSINGNDTTNRGNIYSSPYRTIKYALSQATAGTTIQITSGTYEEIFPLTVPAGVSIIGNNIRDVIVTPTAETSNNDAFLLNGETYISNLTVKDFYYDNVNDAGYAFRFADGFSVTSRSPYIQNISVITKDANAGRGALVDGSAAMSTSLEASMLFHSCTFIVPSAIGLLIKNGSRVEWLNCFTYYAEIGLYAVNGIEGFADQGIRFGGELISIGSANVYGSKGAVADGDSTLMYLINHNFGYIGSDLDNQNDSTLVTQQDEVIELNSGKVYYTSQSEDGDFRVGDAFFVDFNKGSVSFDTSNINFDGVSSIFIQGIDNRTIITAESIEIGDFLLSGNKIQTQTRSFDIDSVSGFINLQDNVTIDKNLLIQENFNISGSINFGNQSSDTISFGTNLDQDLLPKTNITYDLGSLTKKWKKLYSYGVSNESIKLYSNKIESIQTNLDINVVSNGTGKILLDDIAFKNNVIGSRNTNQNILISPASGYSTVIDSSTAMLIPRSVSPISTQGNFRFNTTLNSFEVYGSSLVKLGGLEDQDGNTKISIHPTDNYIDFIANNQNISRMTSTGMTAIALSSLDTLINNNILSTTSSMSINAPTVFLGQNFSISNNTLAIPQDQNFNLTTLLNGYVSFQGTSALTIPSGITDDRPSNPVIGTIRFNTSLNQAEVYSDEGIWIPAGGGTEDATTAEYVEEQITFWSLIVG
jgi:hypothetical protein